MLKYEITDFAKTIIDKFLLSKQLININEIDVGLMLVDDINNIILFEQNSIYECNSNLDFLRYLEDQNYDFYWKKHEYGLFSENTIFRKRTNVEKILVHIDNKSFDSRNDCNAIIETNSNRMIYGCKNSTFPLSISILGPGCFYHILDKNFNSITIPKHISEIQELCFSQSIYLQNIIFLGNINKISDSSFGLCCSLKSIKMPYANPKTIEEDAFYGCYSLDEMVLPDSIEIICSGAFDKCFNLKNIKLSKNLLTIKSNAFANCQSLKYMIIPENVKYIDDNAFLNCNSLTSIYIKSFHTRFHSSNINQLNNVNIFLITLNHNILLNSTMYKKLFNYD